MDKQLKERMHQLMAAATPMLPEVQRSLHIVPPGSQAASAKFDTTSAEVILTVQGQLSGASAPLVGVRFCEELQQAGPKQRRCHPQPPDQTLHPTLRVQL